MPELPEVEAARRSLQTRVVGDVIASVAVYSPTSIRTHRPAAFAKLLRGKRIRSVHRRGKTLQFALTGGWTMLCHFKLWGIVRFSRAAASPDRHTAVVLSFSDGSSLEFRELQLSELGLHRTPEIDRIEYLASLGVEPLSAAFTKARFREMLAGRGAIKALLTDQTRIAGIGNLWALEVLHAARIRPDRPASSLSPQEADVLYRTIRRVLRHAIAAGGEPEFVDAAGRKGRWRLAVYGRDGQPCPRSDGTISMTRLGGRPSFYCPHCQR
jgi:formamidopyrimidine-DNA glycosylase